MGNEQGHKPLNLYASERLRETDGLIKSPKIVNGLAIALRLRENLFRLRCSGALRSNVKTVENV